jgi:pilus assembly protein CpaB
VSRRRRAALLLGLALVLGALAASDVARRERALREQVGPAVDVVVASGPLAAGRRLEAGDLAVRRVPERFASGGVGVSDLVVGRRLAVDVPEGAPLDMHLLEEAVVSGPVIRRGERAAEVIARASPELVVSGVRVDVVVTREQRSELAIEDVEVLAARPVPAEAREGAGPQVAATLRVTVPQAVYLAAAATYATEIRLLVRSPGDRAETGRPAVARDLTLSLAGR